jgi:hypothetical protein
MRPHRDQIVVAERARTANICVLAIKMVLRRGRLSFVLKGPDAGPALFFCRDSSIRDDFRLLLAAR